MLVPFRNVGERDKVPIILKETESVLSMLLDLTHPKRILEIGTAIGYSTAFFAFSCPDAVVYSIEKDEYMHKAAVKNIEHAGLSDRVKLFLGDGEEISRKLNDEGKRDFDLVFIDAAKSHYRRFLDAALEIASDEALIVSDNILQHGMTASEKFDPKNKHKMLPALFFFLTDLQDAPAGTRLLEALFQSVTARTAGFNTVDLTSMRSGSLAVLIVLMLIGGAPGSTAGGMKITTFVILLANMAAVLFHREDAQLFGRRVDRKTIRTASALFGIYLLLFAGGALLISTAEQLPLGECLFETASAIGTVGLSLSLTPTLGGLSRAVLIFLMFFGRVGGLTMFYAAISAGDHRSSHLPVETISVG